MCRFYLMYVRNNKTQTERKDVKMTMTTQFNFSDLTLSRTVGVEMEGYIQTRPYNTKDYPSCYEIKDDGSLGGDDWDDYGDHYGVEVNTRPLNKLDILPSIFGYMEEDGWHVDTLAGTHIHVDNRGMKNKDFIKLLWFGKHVEDIMFMFVKKYRRANSYCHSLDDFYLDVFDGSFSNLRWNDMDIHYHFDRYFYDTNGDSHRVITDRYNWLNALSSNHNTIEFRLFHAIEESDEVVRFAYLAHNFVETVANSSIEQLQFIIDSLHSLDNGREVSEAFCKALGLNFRLPLRSESAIAKLERNWNLPVYQRRTGTAQAV